MRVLVCGGRDYWNRDRVFGCLDALNTGHGVRLVITGAARGADTVGAEWASKSGVPLCQFPALWDYYGRPAGHKRNEWMFRFMQPDIAVAFGGGTGTAGAIRIARKAGVQVWEIDR